MSSYVTDAGGLTGEGAMRAIWCPGLSVSRSFILSCSSLRLRISFFTFSYCGLLTLYDSFHKCGRDLGTYRWPRESVFWLAGGGVGGRSVGFNIRGSYFLKFSGGRICPANANVCTFFLKCVRFQAFLHN